MIKLTEKYLEYIQLEKSLSKNTVESYTRDLRDLFLFLEKRDITTVSEVSAFDLMHYLSELETAGKSVATISRMAATIRSFFGYMYEERLIDQNPAKKLKTPKLDRKVETPLTVNQVEHLLKQPNLDNLWGKRDHTMLELLYATGIKTSELILLTTGDVNLEYSFLRISGTQKRVVSLSESLKEVLSDYLENTWPQFNKLKHAENMLFLNHQGTGLTRQGFWKIVKMYAEMANISENISPQKLRQSFAYHLIQKSANLNQVNELMGYRQTKSTKDLVETEHERLKAVYEKAKPRA